MGLVVKLLGGRNIRTFLAPPSHTDPWFDSLYKRTMGRAFRYKEHEFALCADRVEVEVVRVKR